MKWNTKRKEIIIQKDRQTDRDIADGHSPIQQQTQNRQTADESEKTPLIIYIPEDRHKARTEYLLFSQAPAVVYPYFSIVWFPFLFYVF